MYGGYAWLTNAIDLARRSTARSCSAGMCGYFVVALSVPEAFHGSRPRVRDRLRGRRRGPRRAVRQQRAPASRPRRSCGSRPANLGNAALVLVGGALGGTRRSCCGRSAPSRSGCSRSCVGNQDFEVAPAHFVERHGLVIIVAIGESIVAIGIGAAELAVDAELVLFAVLGLLLRAALWWTYFGGDDERAEEALAALPTRRARGRRAGRLRLRALRAAAGDRVRRGRAEEGDGPRLRPARARRRRWCSPAARRCSWRATCGSARVLRIGDRDGRAGGRGGRRAGDDPARDRGRGDRAGRRAGAVVAARRAAAGVSVRTPHGRRSSRDVLTPKHLVTNI